MTRQSFRCWLAGEPVPQARPRVIIGRRGAHAFTPAKSADYRSRLLPVLRHEFRGQPAFEGSVRLTLIVYRTRPKSNKADMPCVRPDIDNYAKQVMDALAGAGVLQDDGQVCSLYATKFWARDKVGVQVEVETI